MVVTSASRMIECFFIIVDCLATKAALDMGDKNEFMKISRPGANGISLVKLLEDRLQYFAIGNVVDCYVAKLSGR